MVVLALVFIGLGPLDDQTRGAISGPVQVAIYLITAIFVLEFAVRFYAAESRWGYLKYHCIDLLAVLPSARFLRVLGLARLTILLRLFRIGRLAVVARSLADANRATRQLRWIGERNGLPALFLVAVGLLWVGSGLAYEFEHAGNTEFKTYGDAFWWAFSTMATLGSGHGPLSLGGRVVAGILMIVGIACFGLITATVTTFIMQRTEGVHEYSSSDLMGVMKDLQGRLARMEKTLGQTHTDERAASEAIGLGKTVAVTGSAIAAGALVADNALVHLGAFATTAGTGKGTRFNRFGRRRAL